MLYEAQRRSVKPRVDAWRTLTSLCSDPERKESCCGCPRGAWPWVPQMRADRPTRRPVVVSPSAPSCPSLRPHSHRPARGVSRPARTPADAAALCSHTHTHTVCVLRGVRPQSECEGLPWAARRCAPAQTRTGSPKDESSSRWLGKERGYLSSPISILKKLNLKFTTFPEESSRLRWLPGEFSQNRREKKPNTSTQTLEDEGALCNSFHKVSMALGAKADQDPPGKW